MRYFLLSKQIGASGVKIMVKKKWYLGASSLAIIGFINCGGSTKANTALNAKTCKSKCVKVFKSCIATLDNRSDTCTKYKNECLSKC